MDNLPIGSISQMEDFLKCHQNIEMRIEREKDRYEFIKQVLLKTHYRILKKKEKIIINRYLCKLTGYSKEHLKKLIKKWKLGILVWNKQRKRNRFSVKYFASDIACLIETDIVHSYLNGKATKEILRREYEVFHNEKYKTISQISVSHIYNIRNNSLQWLCCITLPTSFQI